MTPKQYHALKDRLEKKTAEAISAAFDKVKNAQHPSRIRAAKASDIVVGKILWHNRKADRSHLDDLKTGQIEHYQRWDLVESVHRPSDEFNGWTSERGCNYGLHRMYVQKEESKK